MNFLAFLSTILIKLKRKIIFIWRNWNVFCLGSHNLQVRFLQIRKGKTRNFQTSPLLLYKTFVSKLFLVVVVVVAVLLPLHSLFSSRAREILKTHSLLISPWVFAQCRYPESSTELDLIHYLRPHRERKKPLLLRMGSVPSTPRRGGAYSPETAEYLIGTFVGDTPFPLSSEFWQKLLELPLNVQWPTQRVQQACELLG